MKRAGSIVASGVRLIVLLALSDDGAPSYDHDNAAAFAALGCAVFACTPEQFPPMMAAAIEGRDLRLSAAEHGITTARPDALAEAEWPYTARASGLVLGACPA